MPDSLSFPLGEILFPIYINMLINFAGWLRPVAKL